VPTPHPDDDDDDVVRFLLDQGVTAAREFRGLPLAKVQQRVAAIQRDPNWKPGAITKSLRQSPPRADPAPADEDDEPHPLYVQAQQLLPDAHPLEINFVLGLLANGASEDEALRALEERNRAKERAQRERRRGAA